MTDERYAQLIKDTFAMYPQETKGFELHPYMKSARKQDLKVIVKRDGKLYKFFKSVNNSTNGSKNKRSGYDWEKTYNILKTHIENVSTEEKPAAKATAAPKATTRNLMDEFDETDADVSMTGQGLRLNKLIGRAGARSVDRASATLGLTGRGFKGGSRAAMNKDHLQKQIGTKFVVLKALREGFLVLRYPSGPAVATAGRELARNITGKGIKGSPEAKAHMALLRSKQTMLQVGIIYRIFHNDSDIQYVGSTMRSLYERWMEHVRNPTDES
ncbi:hypothetical protein DYB37_012194 [Aphanomyces astaci]|uniref:GIY-YIG domain-containing protein n=1 Tax=Aphanomyces astaci TaxID=112090 RepID=A0A418D3K2_APHAT|nr:hypothetical protein DYB35_011057 [Aphanomyces astaci]RHZ17957.1 hypothetical protein DYB37_012194 [Aphanomyces astaci]